jgi:hypothetical protein
LHQQMAEETMKAKPEAVLRQLQKQELDPNSTIARLIVEEVTERVLRDMRPQKAAGRSFTLPFEDPNTQELNTGTPKHSPDGPRPDHPEERNRQETIPPDPSPHQPERKVFGSVGCGLVSGVSNSAKEAPIQRKP